MDEKAMTQSLDHPCKGCQELEAECASLRESLESIASQHRPRHDKEEYWLKIDHAQCATVLATDTKIAREALKSPAGAALLAEVQALRSLERDVRAYRDTDNELGITAHGFDAALTALDALKVKP